MSETINIPIWGIHAGHIGDSHKQFIEKNVIALGWTKLGDLSKICKDKVTLRTKIVQSYPEKKKGTHSIWAGELFRYMNEVKIGHLVIYPSMIDHLVYLGIITGDFIYDASQRRPNTYPAQWLKKYPRGKFSPDALRETGNRLSFFRINNNISEFLEIFNSIMSFKY